MAQQIGIDILARTGQAQKELAGFGKILERHGKLWSNLFGGRGSSGASSNLQAMSKGMERLGKSADQANQRLRAINQTLEQTVKTRMKLVDAQGRVGQKDRDQYEGLLEQEKALAAQQKSWTRIAAIRQQMAQNAGQGASQSGSPLGPILSLPFRLTGGALNQATGGLGSSAASSLVGAGGVGAVGEALGPVLGAIAVAAIGAGLKGFQAALKQDESLVGFLPRMFPGQMAGVVPAQLATRMGNAGRPFAFNREESIATFQAMSEGGSGFGSLKLDRDAGAAMRLARMFGVDPGVEATALATAQRTGAFHAGDAKRFAGMLAQEIARTGLGPRFDEVQQSTLLLLNRQAQELGTARPGPLMALQTVLNKTGVAGFQGMNGASFIAQMEDRITNPSSEGAEALNFAVARKLGAKSYYQYRFMQDEGLANPRFLPALFGMVSKRAPNPEAAELALSEYFGVKLPKIHALRMSLPGHRFAGLTEGRIASAMKVLQGGGGLLEKGAVTTTEAFPSLQIKRVEILAHEVTLRMGQPILDKVAAGAKKVADAGEPHLADGGQSLWDKAIDITGRVIPVGILARIAGTIAGYRPLSPVGAKWHKDRFLPDGTRIRPGVHFDGMPAPAQASLGAAMALALRAGLHPTITSGVRSYAEQQRAYYRATHGLSRYPAARPGHTRHESGLAVDVAVPPSERPAMNEIMAGVGYRWFGPRDRVHYDWAGAAPGGEVTIRHIIEERGVVAEESKRALKRTILDTVNGTGHHQIRSNPNLQASRK